MFIVINFNMYHCHEMSAILNNLGNIFIWRKLRYAFLYFLLFLYLCHFITEKQRRAISRGIYRSHQQSRRRAVVKSFRQISPFADRPDFVPSHFVRASCAKSGIYSSRWNFRGWRILRLIPWARATAKLAVFFCQSRKGTKWENSVDISDMLFEN